MSGDVFVFPPICIHGVESEKLFEISHVARYCTYSLRSSDGASSIGTTLPGLFGKPKWVEPELEGDVSAAPFGDGCKKGIRGAKDR